MKKLHYAKFLPVVTIVVFTLSLTLPIVYSQVEVAIYDLISRANDPRTIWATCTLPSCSDYAEIPFGSMSEMGGVRYHLNDVLNDGNTYGLVLETHPKWVDNGYIQGWYHNPVYIPESGAKLRVIVGFRQGAGAGRATMQVNLIVPGSSPPDIIPLLNAEIAYADGVRQFTVDLPPETRGNAYEIALVVMAGETSAQDWVAWARVWITARVGVVATTTSTATTTVRQTTTQTTTVAMGTTSTATVTQTTTVSTATTATTTRVETSPTTVTQTTTQTVQSPTTRVETTTQTITNTVTQTQVQPTVILQTVTVQGGLTSRCLIATAAFGSELDPSVQTLRQFRDGFVLQTFAGRTFMDVFNAFYYSWSPAVAEAEYANLALRETVKYLIYPLIGSLQLSRMAAEPLASMNSELSVITAGIIASTLLGTIYLAPITLAVGRCHALKNRLRISIYHIGLLMVLTVPVLLAAVYLENTVAVAVLSSSLVLTGLCFGCVMPSTIFRMLSTRHSKT